jgi:hypothetical protein
MTARSNTVPEMDERQKQLVAAAETLRTWVHAQRATWTEGPRTFAHPHSFVAVSGDAVALSPSLPGEPSSFESSGWSDSRESRRRWWREATEVALPSLQAATAFLRTSWRAAAAVVVVLVMIWTVRGHWSGVRTTVSANLAAGRQAVNAQRQAFTQPRTADAPSASVASAPTIATRGGRLQVDSNPPGARVLIDGRERGVTPLTVDGLALGSHKVLIRGEEGSVQRTISIGSTGSVQLNEAIFSGWLHVSSPVDIQISEGRRPIILDDSNQVLLAPGPHDVRLENRALGIHQVRHVDIRPGETTALALDVAVSHLSVMASEQATVAIDGEVVGETPLADHAVHVGTRDVTVTSASGDVRRQTMTITVQPAHLNIDFSKH